MKASVDGRWLLVIPDNSLDWKAIADMSLVKEAQRLPNFSAYAYVVEEKKAWLTKTK
ncbi:MAG: hypothetical protein ABSB53_01580 [Nitrososphaerales archaeon]